MSVRTDTLIWLEITGSLTLPVMGVTDNGDLMVVDCLVPVFLEMSEEN